MMLKAYLSKCLLASIFDTGHRKVGKMLFTQPLENTLPITVIRLTYKSTCTFVRELAFPLIGYSMHIGIFTLHNTENYKHQHFTFTKFYTLSVSKKGKIEVLLITKVRILGFGISVTITLKSTIHIKLRQYCFFQHNLNP